MIDTFLKVRDLLDARERRNTFYLFCLILVMGLLETAGVASIMPFIAVVSDPEVVHTKAYLSYVYTELGFSNTDDFLFALGILVLVTVIISIVFKAFTHWMMSRFIYMRDYSLSSRLLEGYIRRPYTWFLDRHSADLGKSILSEVGQVINTTLLPSIQFVANIIVSMFLIILVVLVDPLVALSSVVVLGGAYLVIYMTLRKYLSRIGSDRVVANQQRFKITQEAFGGIKDVKVLGLEDSYIQGYRQPAYLFALRQASNQVISVMPRFLLEAIAFGGMIALILFMLSGDKNDLGGVMSTIALYAFAGYRLMPALQLVYQALTKLRFGKPSLDILHADLVATGMIQGNSYSASTNEKTGHVPVNQSIQLNNIHYTYPAAHKPALCGLDINIAAKTTIAFVGSTGSGKTTTADIILGLLCPQNGELLVDDTSINDSNLRAWQRNLGYVPQHIFLTDDTVAKNIAFGVSDEEIDYVAVEKAAQIAELHDFVTRDMPDGYQTMIGERGVKLSGGQRQRIGIARALYHDPDVLIMDEATSALDNLTEKAVMDAVHNLGHRKTIILIAHRLSTVKECDKIFMLEGGCLLGSGSFDELIQSSESFRAMASKTG